MSNERINAYVDKIIFFNKSNNYYIIGCTYDKENLVVTGNFINIDENQHYEFLGEFVEHPKYGLQFKAIQAGIILPSNKEMIVSFLSGPNFSGIGEKLATKIYNEYCDSEDILNDILNNKDRLSEVKGLTSTKIDAIINGILEHTKENGLFEFLSKFKIEYNDVVSIFNRANIDVNEFIGILTKNPYLLMSKSISFKSIDKFASLLEIDDFYQYRSAAYLLSIIKNECFKSGSTFITTEELELIYNKSPQYHCEKNLKQLLNDLVDDLLIVVIEDKVFEYEQYDNEKFIAEFINEFGLIKNNEVITKYIEEYERKHGIIFNDQQKEAIDNGINCSISIITGGPGTGKSTIVDALVKIIKKLDKRMLIGLVAPTGKASKRLSDLTDEKSMTIHKLLKYDLHSNTFNHNIFNPIDYDVLIVDEVSMVDNLLMGSLLKASFNVKKIILLGDYHQLPSVSQGQILKDLIESQRVYVTKLNQIYRQQEGSSVIEMAYRVLKKNNIDNDFFNNEVELIDLYDNNKIQRCLKEYNNYVDKNKIQILSPMYKGRLGIDNINKNIQKLIHKNDFINFTLNDRVIQLKNRNDDEIYNGDIGVVVNVDSNVILVDFDGKIISYNKSQQIDLKLAYCISIHKSQGNEYDQVILFLPDYCLHFIDNKILYTAITRTKKKLTIISNLETINQGIKNMHHSNRNTYLKHLLEENYELK